MTYASQFALSQDPEFRGRVTTCAKEQASIFKDDGRYSIAALADSILGSAANAAPVFEAVCVAPNFRDVNDQAAAQDADILAAVQAVWIPVADALYPDPGALS